MFPIAEISEGNQDKYQEPYTTNQISPPQNNTQISYDIYY